MAVTITKKFWDGTLYKDISKIVFTSPNFTSPATAGTKSHIQPGSKYIGTWYEAIDFMYRQKANQDYTDYPMQMESIFGNLTLMGKFDFNTDTTATFFHRYGLTYDVVGTGVIPNILYKDKDNFASVVSATPGTATISGIGEVTTEVVVLNNIVGSAILNEWITSTSSGIVSIPVMATAGQIGSTVTAYISNMVEVDTDSINTPTLSGILEGDVTGQISSVTADIVSGSLTGDVLGTLIALKGDGKGTVVSSQASGQMSVVVSGTNYGTATGPVSIGVSAAMGISGSTVTATVSGIMTATATDADNTTVSGVVVGSVSGVVSGAPFGVVTGTLTGSVSGILTNSSFVPEMYCNVAGAVTANVTGIEYTSVSGTTSGNATGTVNGPVYGTAVGTITGPMVAPQEVMYHQYTSTPVGSSATVPRPRRHHGDNSVIFTVDFGEAYSCRLTAWDDDTHSTTNNKILSEEHYRVDAVAYRSNVLNTGHSPTLNTNRCLVFPPGNDIVLKGDDRYYGDFDLVFVINAGEYGEYLSFIPRLVDMDDSFLPGNYGFVTTLHYQYT